LVMVREGWDGGGRDFNKQKKQKFGKKSIVLAKIAIKIVNFQGEVNCSYTKNPTIRRAQVLPVLPDMIKFVGNF